LLRKAFAEMLCIRVGSLDLVLMPVKSPIGAQMAELVRRQ
jgi:hypothetical protein